MQCTGYTSILFQNTGEVSFETFAKIVYVLLLVVRNVMFLKKSF